MRLVVGLSIPLLFAAALLLMSQQAWAPSTGIELIAGLVLAGAVTGYILKSRWSILYAPVALGICWVMAMVFEVGEFSFSGYESQAMIVVQFVVLLSLVAFAARTGREIAI